VVRLNRIYTRTGDTGETGLVDGSRLSKADPRMAATGEVDELNALIGVARLHVAEAAHGAMLARIQNELFDLGADLATPAEGSGVEAFAPSEMVLRIVPAQVARIEAEIDAMNAVLEPLRSFILPGGSPAAAHVHVARAAARRAERAAVAAGAGVPLNPHALAYLNRLSDHLFVLARAINAGAGGDVLWQPGATRGG
jgi:cob(I)alamin adenosyltransferase